MLSSYGVRNALGDRKRLALSQAHGLQKVVLKPGIFQETSAQETQPQTTGNHPEESRRTSQSNVTEMRYDRQFDRALDRLLQYRAAREQPEKSRENPAAA